MPRFSDDDVLNFFVTEAVVFAGVSAENEAQRANADQAERESITKGHREWAEQHNLIGT